MHPPKSSPDSADERHNLGCQKLYVQMLAEDWRGLKRWKQQKMISFHWSRLFNKVSDSRDGYLSGKSGWVSVNARADALETQSRSGCSSPQAQANFDNKTPVVLLLILPIAPYGATVWMINFAGKLYPFVILASPVSQPSRSRHSSRSSGPAAAWIAPSTPPPPSNERFTAFTMASTESVVMSAWIAFMVAILKGMVFTSHSCTTWQMDLFAWVQRQIWLSCMEPRTHRECTQEDGGRRTSGLREVRWPEA